MAAEGYTAPYAEVNNIITDIQKYATPNSSEVNSEYITKATQSSVYADFKGMLQKYPGLSLDLKNSRSLSLYGKIYVIMPITGSKDRSFFCIIYDPKDDKPVEEDSIIYTTVPGSGNTDDIVPMFMKITS